MIVSLILAAALSTTPVTPVVSDESDRQDNYESMLSCAAFHTIEATRTEGSAAEAQQAVAYDFAETAVGFAPDGTVETANADLEKLLGVFREELDTKDVRVIAEDWTALESACRSLYAVKDDLVRGVGVAAEEAR